MDQRLVRIAIIGAGAKAAAIAAKAEVLNRDKNRPVRFEITIFEATAIGANWTGRYGLTDGQQRLCTASERDLGFPYKSVFQNVDTDLHATYSWQTFAIETGIHDEWLDRGRKPASHAEFASYLSWAIRRSGARYVQRRVKSLIHRKFQPNTGQDDAWRVEVERPHKKHSSDILFNAVVITGPGSANCVPKYRLGTLADRVFDGENFWKKRKNINAILARSKTSEIAIIGGGGTAAAVIAWLVKNGHERTRIYVINGQATLYARIDSAFENKVFSDLTQWAAMSPKNRTTFFTRVNRGVVWNSVLDSINSAIGLIFHDGKAVKIVRDKDTELAVMVEKWNGQHKVGASIVIDASGFDPWWFRKLLHDSTEEKLWKESWKKNLSEEMGPHLDFVAPHWRFPPLHAPMLSSAVGPGFASLMVLGHMSDAVLSAYAPSR